MALAAFSVVREPTITMLSRPQFSEPAHLPVQWIGDASDGERLTEYAGRLRHGSQQNPAERSTQAFLESARQHTHESLLVHATYSVLIEGVTAALVGEMERHQGFACTARSRRYVDASHVRLVIPPAIIGDAALELAFSDHVAAALDCYVALTESLLTRFAWVGDTMQRRKLAREAAGAVLPLSIEGAVIATGSVCAWRTMIAHHGGEKGELEGRRLAVAVLRLFQHETPACFGDFAITQASDRRERTQVL